jgi:hypothetical protein
VSLLLDAVLGVFAALGRGGRDATPGERLAAFLGLLLFPLAAAAIVLLTSVHDHPAAALGPLPLGFAVLAWLSCRLAGARPRETLATTFGCLALCVLGGASALLLALVDSLYSGF